MKYPLRSLIIAFLIALAFFRLGQENPLVNSSAVDLNMSAANDVWQVVQDKYLRAQDVKKDDLKYGLAKGLVSALQDQHSVFFDPKEAENFLSSLNGSLEGIGAELKLEEGIVFVVTPLPKTPAERAGILPGDVILKVDGKLLGNVTNLLEVVMKIRGPRGTTVTLTVLHKDDPKSYDIVITRESIHVPAVSYEEKEFEGRKIPVIRLSTFSEKVDEEFGDALKKAAGMNEKQLVLDMRYNGGGYLDGAIDVTSYFVKPDTPVVKIRDRKGMETRNSVQKSLLFEGKIAVLVNEASASASEIVAGALKDYGLARILGEKSFGKGSVQEVQRFRDASAMRITIAEWLTPKENSIEGVGVEPDQKVELNFEEFKKGKDNQMEAAMEYVSVISTD